jgi:hypothetical protein
MTNHIITLEPSNITLEQEQNITRLQCFICRDYSSILYKICDCNDSIICHDCYNIDNTQNMNKCGICRKDYSFNLKRNYCDFYKIIFKYGTKYTLFLFVELFCPIFFYSKTEITELTNVFLIYSLFCVFVLNIINYYLTTQLIETHETVQSLIIIYNPIKCIYICILFIIIQYIRDIYKYKLYAYYILLFIYTIPLIFYSTIIALKMGIKCIKYINALTIQKTIKIKSTIYQT